jgi:hypothetical protein
MAPRSAQDGPEDNQPIDGDAEVYSKLCALAEALWHHIPPDQWDDLFPATSREARAAANKILDIVQRRA